MGRQMINDANGVNLPNFGFFKLKKPMVEPSIPCTKDLHICPDGSSVVRDPENNCEFRACPSTGSGGTCVGELESFNEQCSPHKDRESCENEGVSAMSDGVCDWITACAQDLHICPDGSSVIRDPELNCEFPPCAVIDCSEDLHVCPDGSSVSRDPEINCEFPECPEKPMLFQVLTLADNPLYKGLAFVGFLGLLYFVVSSYVNKNSEYDLLGRQKSYKTVTLEDEEI